MKTKTKTVTVLQQALASLAPEALDARLLADAFLLAERVDALVALLNEKRIAAAFALLGPAYPAETKALLEEGAKELRRLGTKQKDREATEERAMIPAALADEATALRNTLRKVLEYHFEDDATLGPVLADIRRGRGYRDLATDLTRYAEMARAQAKILRTDRQFQAADVDRADTVAEEIFAALGRPKDAPTDKALRGVQTVVRIAYERTLAAARLALFDAPEQASRFTALLSGTRTAKKAPKKTTPA